MNGLPNTPTAKIFNFRVGGGEVLDLAPFKYGHTDLLTEVVDVKHFTERNVSSVTANVRRSERADDGYTFCQHSKVNEVSLITLNQLGVRSEKEQTNIRMS